MAALKRVVALVVGTRPEVIKMAPVWSALRASPALEPLLVSTGQHREMLDQAFAVFGLRPDIDLELMQPGQSLPDLTSRVLCRVTDVLRERRPAAVLVQGDTTTVLGATLAAFYERIPVGHVEAGLRTRNFEAPWPEEMNRRLADPISRWCFAPTEWSAANLRAECIAPDRIFVTGNTVVDALLWVRAKLGAAGLTMADVVARCGIPEAFARRYLVRRGEANGALPRWILVTGHRRESFGQGFMDICRALSQLAENHPDVGLLYPVHLNPNVRGPVREMLGGHDRIALIEPVGYEDFVRLMDACHFLLSDSGGVQEEAPTLRKPVLVMRDTTERPEGLAGGTSRLVGTNPDIIVSEATRLLESPEEYAARAALRNPYGDGTAAQRIVAILERDLQS